MDCNCYFSLSYFIFVCLSETIMLDLRAWINLFEPSYDQLRQHHVLFVICAVQFACDNTEGFGAPFIPNPPHETKLDPLIIVKVALNAN